MKNSEILSEKIKVIESEYEERKEIARKQLDSNQIMLLQNSALELLIISSRLSALKDIHQTAIEMGETCIKEDII